MSFFPFLRIFSYYFFFTSALRINVGYLLNPQHFLCVKLISSDALAELGVATTLSATLKHCWQLRRDCDSTATRLPCVVLVSHEVARKSNRSRVAVASQL